MNAEETRNEADVQILQALGTAAAVAPPAVSEAARRASVRSSASSVHSHLHQAPSPNIPERLLFYLDF